MGNCQQACQCSKDETFKEDEKGECKDFSALKSNKKIMQTANQYTISNRKMNTNTKQNEMKFADNINHHNSQNTTQIQGSQFIEKENYNPNQYCYIQNRSQYQQKAENSDGTVIIEQDSKQMSSQKFEKLQEFPLSFNSIVEQILSNLGPFQFDQDTDDIGLDSTGPIQFSNGSIYEGQLKNNKRHGKGRQLWFDGSLYEGYWLEDAAAGKGRLIHSDGDVYFGEWLLDKAHGRGIYLHYDGAKYQGEWYEDKQHGYGIETWVDGTKYEGQYSFGKKHGKGVFQWIDGSSYQGDFQNNSIQGQGLYKWIDGRQYDGQWHDNKMNGKGVFTFPDGRAYEGFYHNDKKQGYGEFVWPDGKRYQGEWKNGKQNGYGTIILSDGTTKQGLWENGKLKSEENNSISLNKNDEYNYDKKI